MKQLMISKIVDYDCTVWELTSGIIIEFGGVRKKTPLLASMDGGTTWSVVTKDNKGKVLWKSEIGLQGLLLDRIITQMYKECGLGSPDEAIEVAHIMMVRSLTH